MPPNAERGRSSIVFSETDSPKVDEQRYSPVKQL